MNRRRILSGLCILPFTQTLRGTAAICAQACTGTAKPFYVIIEGPFLIVLNRKSAGSAMISGITAFTPVENQHRFKLNGVPFAGATKYKFTLSEQPGLTPYTSTCVDASLRYACVDTIPALGCKPDDAFIRVNLPCPKRIFTRYTVPVTFADNTQGFMPQDHVLEYEIASSSPVTMKYEGVDTQVDASGNHFRFEIGLLPGTSAQASAQHAVEFHNGQILKCFKLEADRSRQIKEIASVESARISVAVKAKELSKRTTTLECKAGGMIGGTP